MSETHEVFNQPPPLEGHNVFTADAVLSEAVRREGAAWAEGELRELGVLAGSPEAIAWGFQANENPPVLHTHDRYGHRSDTVAYHPAYHRLMEVAIAHGLHASPWADERPGAHVARAAKMIVWSQVDAGHTCPISMTYSVVPALRHQPDVAADWEPRVVSRRYDGTFAPAGRKDGVTFGMAMTEKQGGSDVRANTTRAEPTASDGEYLVTGHKWFCSAPMSDAFLVLAYAPGGLTCFLLPRWRPDGTVNAFRIQRLKDKLGDRSNASSEVEFAGAWARRVGEEGHGVRTIIEMVNHTRLDCVLGSTAHMRHGTAQAAHHAAHRQAFGRTLADQPLMGNVLADLAVESEAATVTALRLARAYDSDDEHERLLKRLATPVSKYWICKRGPVHAAEALECLGGNGFVEASGLPRLFRQSPLNGVWEGSGNVICLDVLRAMGRSPESVEAFFAELDGATGADARLDNAVARLRKELADLDDIEVRARRVVEAMALAFQGSLLVRHGDPAVADAFCASRLDGDAGRALGTLPPGVDVRGIVARHTPHV
ncbi:MAG: isovaleryl-CoA dehydrogenase [Actinobacteria bacterium]|nr:isovaleryl-CoA dehydrogenase [Actinomycetota bacterium]